MKSPALPLLGGLSLVLASCGALNNVNQPLDGSNFDPLNSPGSKKRSSSNLVTPTGPSYTPGQWVETAMANSTFFRAIPKGNASADKVLKAGTPLKVVKAQGSFIKVELDSGDVGYVPSIMVTERRAQSNSFSSPRSPNEVPIIPITPGTPTSGSASGLPELPDLPPLPDVDGGNTPPPLEVPLPPPLPVEVPTITPSVRTEPLPDLPPPPSVPGVSVPIPVE